MGSYNEPNISCSSNGYVGMRVGPKAQATGVDKKSLSQAGNHLMRANANNTEFMLGQ